MPRLPLLLLLSAALLGACSRGSDEAARPGPGSPGAPVADATSRSTFELDSPAIGEVGNLCLFRPRKDPVMIAYKDRTGAAWEGEVRVRDLPGFDTKWIAQFDKRVATVVARPRVDKFRVKVDGNCHDAARRTYYACTKVLEADVSAVRGFARAPTVAEASALAIQLCEKKVAEIVEKSIEITQDNQDLRCRVTEQTWCDLPAAPPPPPAAAKKK
jgi:hypothetical protein